MMKKEKNKLEAQSLQAPTCFCINGGNYSVVIYSIIVDTGQS